MTPTANHHATVACKTLRREAKAACTPPPLAATLEHAARQALDLIARPPRRLARGEHLFHAGDPGLALYVIESGSVKLYIVTPSGEEQVLGFCFPGELFGLDALGVPVHSCSAVALEPTTVRALPALELEAQCQRVPELQHEIHRLLGRRIGDLHAQMTVLGKKRAEERLASFLVNLAVHFARPEARQTELRLSMTRYEIGCYLGLALETVSRLLRRFHDEGLIRMRARHIRLLDLPRLRTLAGMVANDSAAAVGRTSN